MESVLVVSDFKIFGDVLDISHEAASSSSSKHKSAHAEFASHVQNSSLDTSQSPSCSDLIQKPHQYLLKLSLWLAVCFITDNSLTLNPKAIKDLDFVQKIQRDLQTVQSQKKKSSKSAVPTLSSDRIASLLTPKDSKAAVDLFPARSNASAKKSRELKSQFQKSVDKFLSECGCPPASASAPSLMSPPPLYTPPGVVPLDWKILGVSFLLELLSVLFPLFRDDCICRECPNITSIVCKNRQTDDEIDLIILDDIRGKLTSSAQPAAAHNAAECVSEFESWAHSQLGALTGLSDVDTLQAVHHIALRTVYLLAHASRHHATSLSGTWDTIKSQLSSAEVAYLAALSSASSSSTSLRTSEKGLSLRRRLGIVRSAIPAFDKSPSTMSPDRPPSVRTLERKMSLTVYATDDASDESVASVYSEEDMDPMDQLLAKEKSRPSLSPRASTGEVFKKGLQLSISKQTIVCTSLLQIQPSLYELWVSLKDGSVTVFNPVTMEAKQTVISGRDDVPQTSGRCPESHRPRVWSMIIKPADPGSVCLIAPFHHSQSTSIPISVVCVTECGVIYQFCSSSKTMLSRHVTNTGILLFFLHSQTLSISLFFFSAFFF